MTEEIDELAAYDYELPRDRIAQHPISSRVDARLMHLDRRTGAVSHHHVRSIGDLLNPGDALVLNDTRVIPARLSGYRKRTRGAWQGLFLRCDPERPLVWEVLSKTRGYLETGERIVLRDRHGREGLELEVLTRLPSGSLAVRPTQEGNAFELLEAYGTVPIPPYIREGRMVDDDLKNYQTVFARHNGSVAAPTAGLHFTAELMRSLAADGIEFCAVTLHVGIGTFRPIKAQKLADHQMHSEWGSIDAKTVERLNAVKAAGKRVIAVGTTTVRVLETAGASGKLTPWTGETDLFIRPGYQFRAIDG